MTLTKCIRVDEGVFKRLHSLKQVEHSRSMNDAIDRCLVLHGLIGDERIGERPLYETVVIDGWRDK
jgi:hypothetical protein